MMRVDKNILRDIDRNLRVIQSQDTNYRCLFYNRRRDYLQKLANFHSAALEEPISAKLALYEGSRGKSHRKILKENQVAIRTAWRILHNAENPIDEETWKRVNGIILTNGDLESQGTPYRTERVSLGLQYTPPSYTKVPELMLGLATKLQQLEEEKKVHPVEIAIDAHFGIASTQPFPDGNKRTARLVQGRILEKNGYPVPVIAFGERELYLKFFDEAAYAVSDSKERFYNPKLTNFADYIASKVNLSLERILGRNP